MKERHTDGGILENVFLVFAAQDVVFRFLDTFKEFPPRQEAPSFSVDQAVEKLEKSLGWS